MAKNSDAKVKDSAGGVPPSKSQRAKGAKLARAAKSGKVTNHGGVCSSCGQISSSCTTNTPHDSCDGFVKNYDFKDPILNTLGESFPMLADGTIIKRAVPGKWITTNELAARRAERKAEAYRIAKERVVMTSVYKLGDDGLTLMVETQTPGFFAPVLDYLDICNGLGDPISYVGGKWRTEQEVNEYQIAYEMDAAAGAAEAANDVVEKSVDIESILDGVAEAA